MSQLSTLWPLHASHTLPLHTLVTCEPFQVGVAAAVIAITYVQLTNYTLTLDVSNPSINTQCLLGVGPADVSLCTLSFVGECPRTVST